MCAYCGFLSQALLFSFSFSVSFLFLFVLVILHPPSQKRLTEATAAFNLAASGLARVGEFFSLRDRRDTRAEELRTLQQQQLQLQHRGEQRATAIARAQSSSAKMLAELDISTTTATFRTLFLLPPATMEDVVILLTMLPQLHRCILYGTPVTASSPADAGSDKMEEFFARVRAGNGSCTNPTVAGFSSAFSRTATAALLSVGSLSAQDSLAPAHSVLRKRDRQAAELSDIAPRPSLHAALLAALRVRAQEFSAFVAPGAPAAPSVFSAARGVVDSAADAASEPTVADVAAAAPLEPAWISMFEEPDDEIVLLLSGYAPLPAPAMLTAPSVSMTQAQELVQQQQQRVAVLRLLGYCLRVAATIAHKQCSSADSDVSALSCSMLRLLDTLSSSTLITAADSAPSQQHIDAAIASGTLLSQHALSLLPAPATIVAPSALGPAIAAGRRRRSSSNAASTPTAAPLNGVLAPNAAVVDFAAALAARLAERCNNTALAMRGVDFFIALTNDLLADSTLLERWNTAVPSSVATRGFSVAAVSGAVHCIVVRQFARSYVTAWLRRDVATALSPSLALRTKLRAGASTSTAASSNTTSSATNAPSVASSSSPTTTMVTAMDVDNAENTPPATSAAAASSSTATAKRQNARERECSYTQARKRTQ